MIQVSYYGSSEEQLNSRPSVRRTELCVEVRFGKKVVLTLISLHTRSVRDYLQSKSTGWLAVSGIKKNSEIPESPTLILHSRIPLHLELELLTDNLENLHMSTPEYPYPWNWNFSWRT